MKYRLHPEAREDVREAARFYRERGGTTLAQAFLGEVSHTVELIAQYPTWGAPWQHGTRRLVLRRFPFSIVYTISGHDIRVLAVAHHSRRPGYWRQRTRY